jgi:group I intron endonuclease
MTIGIYEIQIGEYFYHGSALNLKNRMHTHKSKLKSGTHHNPKMQAVYDKYKEFKFTVVLECKKENLHYMEQATIDQFFGDKNYMNLAKVVEVPMLGRKHSAETKAKIGLANKGKVTNLGIIRSEETKLNMSQAAFKREAKKRELRNVQSE